jgi:hypothetical protein
VKTQEQRARLRDNFDAVDELAPVIGRGSMLLALAESPVYIHAEQPNAASLGVLYVAYSYSAFAGGRQPKPSR